MLHALFPGAICRAEPDYHAALMACPLDTDACLAVGTGSVICSRIDGRLVKSGGRGFLLGDAGSTAQYGRDALLHFLSVGEGGVSPKLRERVLAHFGSLEENEILSRLYRFPTPVSMLVKLASSLAHDFKAGLPYAVASVERNGGLLADVVADHCKRYLANKPTIKIVLAGGLWKLGDAFSAKLQHDLRARLAAQQIEISRISRPPVVGAALLAKESV
jgi:N-acetylglucosamine kinase-like BadF-type ATPase